MGAHFAFHANPYTWGMMPVPAHVAVMEALREAGGNDALVEEMKLWLLKQKQTTSWDSPVATADAVYALLCQGSNLLESKEMSALLWVIRCWRLSLLQRPPYPDWDMLRKSLRKSVLR